MKFYKKMRDGGKQGSVRAIMNGCVDTSPQYDLS